MKIGLVVSEHFNSKYALEFIRDVQASAFAEVRVVRRSDANEPKAPTWLSKKLLNTIIGLDVRFLNSTAYRGHLNKAPSQDLEVLAASSTEEFDFLVSLNAEPVDKTLLLKSKNGALLVEAGIPSGKTGFLGFWEVLNKKAVTPFRIRLQTTEKIENVLTGQLLTQSSFLLNQAYVSRKSLSYLTQYLQKKSLNPDFSWAHLQGNEDQNWEVQTPSSLSLAAYLGKRIFRTIRQKVQSLQNKDQHWNVAFIRDNWQPLQLAKGSPFEYCNDQFFADPFVIHRDGRDICFVEEYDYKTGLGHISAFELKEDKAISLGPVIKESFHMSFPYLFEYQGQLYMCPETSGSKEIRIYKCLEFPLKWEFEKSLMKNIAAVDSLLFEQDGLWWMLTNMDSLQKNDNCTELHAFYADSPLSESWTAHAMNPLIINPLVARNGGMVRDGGKVYRVSQTQEFGVYGASSRINEIQRLTKTEYSEKTQTKIKADFFKNIYGTHHLHSNGSVTVYDFCKNIKVSR
ncbi:hypothetical protein ACLVWU_04500 [Bdellovibrio sp. HCB290]|uniref:glucosamine inositolphosphorylceramide transferase family protein n=1 Tax=Bdellovibrio sp. HCB290 TaxID=3394356 RepID=UPI0039B61EA0